jgi:hypothetical protein
MMLRKKTHRDDVCTGKASLIRTYTTTVQINLRDMS